MAAEEITAGDNTGTEPLACRLTPAVLAAQAGRWERLAALAMTGRTETADGLRISFRCERGADAELRDLVAVENECCPWADWAVQQDGDQLVLDVRSTGAGIATLHGMFTSLVGGTRRPGAAFHRSPPGPTA